MHQLIIIGGGPAALTAAMYAARARLEPLVLVGDQPGGQLMGTTMVENWPGINAVLGPQLMVNIQEHARHAGAQLHEETVRSIDTKRHPFVVTTATQKRFEAAAVIIATGATPRRLGCVGEDTYWGRGVSSCAVCDGALYQNRPVVIVGGGDTAMEDASFLRKFTDTITIVHIKDRLTASAAMQERVLHDTAITIRYTSTITRFEGNGEHLTHIVCTDQITQQSEVIPADGVFLAIGLTPNSSFVTDQIATDLYGYIITQPGSTESSVPGIFAAGDVVDSRYRQAITAAADGCRAALDAERFLLNRTPL